MAKSFQDLSWSINEYAVRHIEETDDWLRVETLVISNIPRLCRGRTQDANHLLLVFRLLTLNHLAKFKEYRVLRTAMKWLLHILGIVSTYAHIYIYFTYVHHAHTHTCGASFGNLPCNVTQWVTDAVGNKVPSVRHGPNG